MLKLKVPDMSCGHCVRTIENAVKGLDPAAVVKADIPAAMVVVESTADEARITSALLDAGYMSEKVAA